jgi:hypothetical protein
VQRALGARKLVAPHGNAQALGWAAMQHDEPRRSAQRLRSGIRVRQHKEPAGARGNTRSHRRFARRNGRLCKGKGLGNSAVEADADDAQHSRDVRGSALCGVAIRVVATARNDRVAAAART